MAGMVLLARCLLGGSTAVGAEPRLNFQREIRPLLAEHCFQCHGPDEGKRRAGLRLDRRDVATAQLPSGETAIVAGKAVDSELIRRIESADPALVMPPPQTKRQLTGAQKQLLRRWIEEGAEYQVHWAYLKPVRPPPPPTRNQAWPRNDIDRFVLAKLEANSRTPAPEADRSTLIRRLSLDLTGLPPAIEEVDQFLADDSPDAYPRLVDRLLASPHYGEKMAQNWLDLARFGDSSGYQDDGERPDWPYRDYVVAAFNAGMPFDQFTIENLAGDLLPNATLAQKIASGFNRLHRHNEEGGSDPEEFQVVYAVDRTNTTATTWMGLTFGCAQCHDHKYDPITQREYYQLYAFFNSLRGEIVINKGPNSPPQIRVSGPDEQIRLDRLSSDIATVEARAREMEPAVAQAFSDWLKEKRPAGTPPVAAPKDGVPGDKGAVGGIVARSARPAWYADTRIDTALTLDGPLVVSGRVVVVRSVNNEVNVGHFSRNGRQGASQLGFCVAEGPRFFAYVSLPDGSRVLSAPIAAEHGVEYTFTSRYDPAGGLDDPADADTRGEGELTFELRRGKATVGTAQVDLSAAQRGSDIALDTFGISFRGFNELDTPIELYLDDVEYTVVRNGNARREKFDRDPQWSENGNRTGSQRFGYDPNASTSGHASSVLMSLEQILALPAEKRTPEQVARLREHFIQERAQPLAELYRRLAVLRGERDAVEKGVPLALVWQEMETPRPAHVLVRGDYRQRGEVVERNVPAIFPQLPAGAPRDRLALARWLVSSDHPLTARVVADRLWKQFFGAGLVRTPEDVGIRGELPTHPELLDWLAVQLIDDGWQLKRLQRRIVLSSTYRQSSAASPATRQLDPANRLLGRGGRFRLTAEEIRDGALAAAGLLVRRIGGRSVYPYQPDHFYRDKEDDPGEWKWPLEPGANLYRRGLYTFLRRTTPYPAYQTFDAPSRGECMVARSATNTPLQALVTLNDPTFVEAARVLGERIQAAGGATTESRLAFGFRCVLCRAPADRELAVLKQLYTAEVERYRGAPHAAALAVSQGLAPSVAGGDPVEAAAWTAVASALLNLDETINRE